MIRNQRTSHQLVSSVLFIFYFLFRFVLLCFALLCFALLCSALLRTLIGKRYLSKEETIISEPMEHRRL
jgi:hypothetical protein